MARPLRCWVVTDGKAGNEASALGLAEAVGRRLPVEITCERIAPGRPWVWAPPAAWMALAAIAGRDLPFATLPAGHTLRPPWPDLVIGNGRLAGPFVAAIGRVGRRSGRGTVSVQLQDPQVSPAHFDLVIAPEHDGLAGRNVLQVLGSLHRVTPEKIAAAARTWADRLGSLPHPRVAVLIGGKSKSHDMPVSLADSLGRQLRTLADAGHAGLMVTTSRRTGKENTAHLRAALTGSAAYVWDGTGENPYFAMLGLADAIIVTNDSVNMMSEAASTGLPLHIVPLVGGAAKFQRFHEALATRGITRLFDGHLPHWHYTPLRETDRAASVVLELIGMRQVSAPASP